MTPVESQVSPSETVQTNAVAPNSVVRSSGGLNTSTTDALPSGGFTLGPSPFATGPTPPLTNANPSPPVAATPVVPHNNAGLTPASAPQLPKNDPMPSGPALNSVTTGQVLRSFALPGPAELPQQGPSLPAAASFAALDAPVTPPVPPDPIGALLAIPVTTVNMFVTTTLGFATALLNAVLIPAPGAPPDSPLVWAILAFVRRQFFNETPTLTPTVAAPDADGNIKVTLNQTDQDGDALVFTATNGAHGTVTLNADGHSFTYDPDPGFAGPDQFTITATDATYPHFHGLFGFFTPGGGHISTTTVQVTAVVADTNDPPTVVDPDHPFTINSIDSTFGVVKGSINVEDSDGDDLTYSLASVPDPKLGTVVLDDDTGDWTFVPTPAARVRAYATEADDVATFTVTASDGQYTTAPLVVKPTIEPAQAAPYPSIDGIAVGAVRFGPDGTAYQTVLVPGENDTFLFTVSVIGPNSTTPITTAPQPGVPLRFVFGPDGSAYQTSATLVPDTFQFDEYSVTMIHTDGTAASVPLPGTPVGDISFGPDGLAYQSSYLEDTNETTVTVINSVDETSKEITVPGYGGAILAPDGTVWARTQLDPFDPFDEREDTTLWSVLDVENGTATTYSVAGSPAPAAGGLIGPAPQSSVNFVFGPDGTVYQTTDRGFDSVRDYALTLISPTAGASAPIPLVGRPGGALQFDPEGGVVFGPDGTGYLVALGAGEASVVVIAPDGQATTVPLPGVPDGVKILSNGTAYITLLGPTRTVVTISPTGDIEPVVTPSGDPAHTLGFTPDGTVYLIAERAALPGEAPGQYTEVVFDALSDNPTTMTIPGGSISQLQFGPDGTAYASGPYSVTVIDPGRTTATTIPITGTLGNISIGPNGTAYADSTDLQVSDYYVTVIRPDGSFSTVQVPGPTVEVVAGQRQFAIGPDDTAYLTTQEALGNGTFGEYSLTVITPDGTASPPIALGGTPDGELGIVPGTGAAYQIVTLPNGEGTKLLVVQPDSTFTAIVLSGESDGAHFGSDGTIFQRTRVDQGNGNFDYSLTVIESGAQAYITIPLDGTPYGDLVFGPDGTAYQTVELPTAEGTHVLVVNADGARTIELDGIPRSAVTFRSDGTGYVTTAVVDIDTATVESVVWVVAAASMP